MGSPADRLVVTVEELDADDADGIAEFYNQILLPHFSADELEPIENFTAGLKYGATSALVAKTAGGAIAGGAVGDLFQRSNVLLLSYLAVPPAGRGAGVGGTLMKAVTGVWGSRHRPALLVMEVEDPCHHAADAAHGDPVARIRFYERLGARTLPLPYFQPALGPGGHRVPHMVLMVFGGTAAPPGTQRVDGEVVEHFLTQYLEDCEGPLRPDDTAAQRLLAACRHPGGLPLLRVDELPAWLG
jgi:GNAT superfamily N-acetyltransferase